MAIAVKERPVVDRSDESPSQPPYDLSLDSRRPDTQKSKPKIPYEKPSDPDFQLREEMRLWVWYVPCLTPWERKMYLEHHFL